MRTGRKYDTTLLLYVGISLGGVLLILMLGRYSPTATWDFPWRKHLVGSVFILICLSGVAAALFPRRCSGTAETQASHSMSQSCTCKAIGHHFDCDKYSSHVVCFGSHTLCAACSGLVIGALSAVVAGFSYFFSEWSCLGSGFSAVFTGSVLVALGFIQYRFGGLVRMLLNTLFVLGALLTLIGIDSSAHDLFLDVLVLALIVFWIMTRVLISQWDHWRTCSNCASSLRNEKKERS